MTDVTWTDARVARLKKLADDGWSAQQIADELGALSRSAVIGKAYRLGIELRGTSGPHASVRALAKPKTGRTAAKPSAPPAPKATRPPIESRPAPAPQPLIDATLAGWPKPAGPEAVTLAELDMSMQCRMPLWANAEKGGLYCGRPVRREGARYCAGCARLMYEPARSPVRAAA